MTGTGRSLESTAHVLVSTSASDKPLTPFLQVASWMPLLVACAFMVVLLLQWASITSTLVWDSDAAAAPLIAEVFGRPGTGVIMIGHSGWYSMLWLMAWTRDLPGHRELWQVLPYAFVFGALSALALSVRQIRGNWAGAIFLAASVAVGPLALRSLVTPNYHTTTFINVALLGAALPILISSSGGFTRRLAVAVPIGLLTGINVASDALLWVVGVVPFALAVVYGLIRFRNARIPIFTAALATLGSTAVTDRLLRDAMAARDVVTLSMPTALSSVALLPKHLLTLANEVALVFGADLFGTGHEGSVLRNVVFGILVVIVFSVIAFLLVRELLIGKGTRLGQAEQLLLVYAGGTILAVSGAFVLTNVGENSGPGGANYFLALGVSIPLLATLVPHSFADRALIGGALATMMAFNVVGVGSGYASVHAGSVETYAPQILSVLAREHVQYGYASYWDALPLTLYSKGSVHIAAVSQCMPPRGSLCAFTLISATVWFKAHPGSPSFVIVDPETLFVTVGPPGIGPWRDIVSVGPIEIYISPDDVAPQILYRPT
jgi:hypothetical protein